MRLLAASRDLVGLGESAFEGHCDVPNRCWVRALPGLPCAQFEAFAQRPNSPLWGSDRGVVHAKPSCLGLAALTVSHLAVPLKCNLSLKSARFALQTR